MRIYLIRHGKTQGNAQGKYLGSTDEGIMEASAKELSRAVAPKADILFSSPMKRCLQTAAILYKDKTPVIDKDLRECCFGKFEYRDYEELKEDPDYKKWIQSGGMSGCPGGEEQGEFVTRVAAAFERCMGKALDAGAHSVALVIHGGPIMAIMSVFEEPKKDYFAWQVKNGQAVVADYEAGKIKNAAILNQ